MYAPSTKTSSTRAASEERKPTDPRRRGRSVTRPPSVTATVSRRAPYTPQSMSTRCVPGATATSVAGVRVGSATPSTFTDAPGGSEKMSRFAPVPSGEAACIMRLEGFPATPGRMARTRSPSAINASAPPPQSATSSYHGRRSTKPRVAGGVRSGSTSSALSKATASPSGRGAGSSTGGASANAGEYPPGSAGASSTIAWGGSAWETVTVASGSIGSSSSGVISKGPSSANVTIGIPCWPVTAAIATRPLSGVATHAVRRSDVTSRAASRSRARRLSSPSRKGCVARM